MKTALNLAHWVHQHYKHAEPLTHLKIQKLVFYVFGGALAFDRESDVGAEIEFEAWQHGPVNREIWQQFRSHGANPLPLPPADRVRFPALTERPLLDVLTVYGRLSAWDLRQESHLETPWKDADAKKELVINKVILKGHFREKFAAASVGCPAHLFGKSSFSLDGIPVPTFGTLRQLALAVESAS